MEIPWRKCKADRSNKRRRGEEVAFLKRGYDSKGYSSRLCTAERKGYRGKRCRRNVSTVKSLGDYTDLTLLTVCFMTAVDMCCMQVT